MTPSGVPTARLASGQTRRNGRTIPPAPLVLDRYRLHHRLGAGAFGIVWMARDERLERDVAVKALPRERIVGGRFEREARAAARLAHPGIVTLYEAAVDDDGAYLVSELVHGATLDELLQAGRLSDRDIVTIGIALCDALTHAHSKDVIHRDVKPSNVLVPEQPPSSSQLAKLTDFGVARVVGGDSLTRTGDVIGTLAYMAPEQAEGLEVGAGADLYSLALVLYEALTGINPVQTNTAAQRARRLGAYLPPLRRQRRDLPREIGTALDRALRPRPRERGTVAELRAALVAAHGLVGDDPGVVGDSWTHQRARKWTRGSAPDRVPNWSASADQHQDERRDPAPGRPKDEYAEDPSPAAATASDQIWIARGLGGLGSAAAAAWLASVPLAPSPAPPVAVAILAATLTLLLPRLGWLALTAAAGGTAVAQDHQGVALVILVGMLLPALLLIRRPTAWPLAVGAPALGLIGVAGAWPALAARAATAWRRAALGLTGWIWLLLAAPLAGRGLYVAPIAGIPSTTAWEGSPYETVHHVLASIVRSGALAPAPVWALAAVVLPWLVRGQSLRLDLVRVAIWSAVLVSVTAAVLAAVHPSGGSPAVLTAWLGAAVGAGIALAPSVLGAWRAGHGLGGGSEAGFP